MLDIKNINLQKNEVLWSYQKIVWPDIALTLYHLNIYNGTSPYTSWIFHADILSTIRANFCLYTKREDPEFILTEGLIRDKSINKSEVDAFCYILGYGISTATQKGSNLKLVLYPDKNSPIIDVKPRDQKRNKWSVRMII